MNKKYKDLFLGDWEEILIEEKINYNGKEYQVGYTKEYVKVGIVSDDDLSGKVIKAKIVENLGEILLAQI